MYAVGSQETYDRANATKINHAARRAYVCHAAYQVLVSIALLFFAVKSQSQRTPECPTGLAYIAAIPYTATLQNPGSKTRILLDS